MKLTNDVRRVRLASNGDRVVDALVRVRGLDLRAKGRGMVAEQQEPIAVSVSELGREQRIAMAQPRRWPAIAAVAAPVVAVTLARVFRQKRSK